MATLPTHPAVTYVTRRKRSSLAKESTAVLAGLMELFAEKPHMSAVFGAWRRSKKTKPPAPQGR